MDKKGAIDIGFKILSIFVIPVFLWAWKLNAELAVRATEVEVLKTDVAALQSTVEDLDEQDKQIALIQRDVEYIKQGIDGLKTFHGVVR